ncbi:MAG TPA: lamin tail domain-containing protein, partial [Verrucomicrobiae bacterium]
VLAYETYRDGGAPSHFAFPVRVQQNAVFFSVANVVESGDDDFLKRLGLDPQGALYKMYNAADSVATNEKKTRKFEGTADLQALITGMGQSGTIRQTFMFDNLNVPEFIDFLAAKMITADVDCCHKNYYLYCDNDGTGEWQAMPWDVDLSFGRVWTCGTPCYAYYDETIYTNQSIWTGSGNRVFDPIYSTPFTRQMFLRRLRTLMDALCQPPGTPATNDFYRQKTLALRDRIAPDAALDLTKWGTWGTRETITQAVNRIWNEFLPGRRDYLFRVQTVTGGGEIPLPQPTNAVVRIDGLEYRPASGNPLQEWLSLTNANSYAVDISNWRLDGGVRFTFKPGTVLPALSTLIVSPNVKAFRSRTTSPKGGERRLVVGPYEGNLSAWGERLVLLDAGGRLVNSNYYVGSPSPAQQYLRITEISYNPDPFAGNTNIDAQLFEFLELRNIGPAALDLRGVRLTEGVQFSFSSGAITNLQAGARLLVVRDTNSFALRYGRGLPVAGQFVGKLDNAGDRLRLDDSYGEKILDFSYDNRWYPITDGHGYSLVIVDDSIAWSLWGEKASWRPNGALGGTPGQADPLMVAMTPVVINEILTHTDPPLLDAIELYNPTATNVNVGNWYLTDDFSIPRKFQIPNPTWILAYGYVYFTEAQFNKTPGVFPSFVLNSEGDDAWLFSSDSQKTLTGYAQGFDFGATANGVSLGRYVNSVGDADYPAQVRVTLGQTNSGPRVGPIVLAEIMYHPAPAAPSNSPSSFIELANTAVTNVPLYNPMEPTNTWRLRNAVDFDFPTNIVMRPGSRLLVVGFDPQTDAVALSNFRALYNVTTNVPILGSWQGRLGNGDETIELKKPDPWGTNGVPYVMVEKVHYLDHAPWPAAADGTGLSLQRLQLSAYANEPTNWFVSAPTPGVSNQPNQPPTVQLMTPSAGAIFRKPTTVQLSAAATDSDGYVLRVEFRADGVELGEVADEPYSFTWTNPPSGSHVITAVAVDDRLGTAVCAPVSITVIPPAPTITLTQPVDGTVVLTGSTLPVSAAATAADGSIDRVEFYGNGLLLSQMLAPPYDTTWSPSGSGTFALTAVAVDSWGSAATSSVATVAFTAGTNTPLTLVAAGSRWKYLDDGSNLGTNWVGLQFPDGSWPSGPAELGYGDKAEGRPETTEISFGPDATQKYITYYFRQAFTVTQAPTVHDLNISLLRDDGAVVYLNGWDVFRSNMPEGPFDYLTLANYAVAGAEETTYFLKSVDSSYLREGTNLLAVEIHQSSAGSSDISFDLSLTGTRVLLAPAILAQPASAVIFSGGTASFSVTAGGTAPLSYQWMLEGAPIPGATGDVLNVLGAGVDNLGTYQARITNSIGSVLSAPATLSFRDAPGANRLTIAVAGTSYHLLYHGTPGTLCELQRSSDLIHWGSLLETTIPSHGFVEYTEINPPAGGAYYRARQK